MKREIKRDLLPFAVCFFIILIILVFVVIYDSPEPDPEKLNCEIVSTESILTQVDKKICEIIDVQGNIVECFYGSFDYVENRTYGKIWYYEKNLTRIYYVLPGGRIKIYDLQDQE